MTRSHVVFLKFLDDDMLTLAVDHPKAAGKHSCTLIDVLAGSIATHKRDSSNVLLVAGGNLQVGW